MIKNRILYSIILMAALVACYIKENVVVSLFAYTLIFLAFISLIHVCWVYMRFTYTQDINKKFITKGEKIVFYFSAYNESHLFYPHLEVDFYGIDSVFMKYFEKKRICVPEKSKKTFTYEMACKYRGYYEIGIYKIYIIDFLGLYRLPYKVVEPKVITVYPKIVPIKHLPIHPNTIEEADKIANSRIGMGNLTSDVREYSYGDSIRKVHWKLSAKTGKLIVKNEDCTAQLKVHVVLDLKRHEDLEIEARTILEDKLVECVVAILYYYLNQNIPVEFHYFEGKLMTHSAKNLAHFDYLYELLFKIKFKETIELHKVFQMIPVAKQITNYWIGITSGLTYDLYEQMRCIVESRSIAILINVGKEDEVIAKALISCGVIYFQVGIEDDLGQVLEG